MGLFTQRKPRRFNHKYMFVDERKDRIRDIEQRAKASLGGEVSRTSGHERLRGTFLNATRHASKRHERRLAGGFVLRPLSMVERRLYVTDNEEGHRGLA